MRLHFTSSAALLRPLILLYPLTHRAPDLYVVMVMAEMYSHTALRKKKEASYAHRARIMKAISFSQRKIGTFPLGQFRHLQYILTLEPLFLMDFGPLQSRE